VSDDLREEIAAIDQAVMALGFDLNREAVTEQNPKADARFDSLVSLIEELLRNNSQWRDDERLVVFTEYKTTLDYLRPSFAETYMRRSNSDALWQRWQRGMDEVDRDLVKNAFNDPTHSVRILVATDAAAEGLNLQGTARYLLHFDCPWNPSRLEQAKRPS
jgi:superfamily II DNA/RNA helicase